MRCTSAGQALCLDAPAVTDCEDLNTALSHEPPCHASTHGLLPLGFYPTLGFYPWPLALPGHSAVRKGEVHPLDWSEPRQSPSSRRVPPAGAACRIPHRSYTSSSVGRVSGCRSSKARVPGSWDLTWSASGAQKWRKASLWATSSNTSVTISRKACQDG